MQQSRSADTSGNGRAVARAPGGRCLTGLRSIPLLLCLALAAALSAPPPALAGKVVLRIRAANTTNETRTVQIRSDLPAHIGTNDILSLGGLDLGYDVASGAYFVRKAVELGPMEITVFDVEMNDIWVLPADELARLRARARELAAKLKSTDYAAAAEGLQQGIEKTLEAVAAAQRQNSIEGGARPVDHFHAYEANVELLARSKKDIGRLENLVLASRQDPGPLVGTSPTATARKPVEMPPEKYKRAMVRITAHNPSPSETRKVSVRQELPPEIKVEDIVDPAGLDVGRDPKTGNVVVFRDSVEIGPGQTAVFNVAIRDKWNVNEPRIADLRTSAGNLLEKVEAAGTFPSAAGDLQQALDELGKIGNERGPAEMGESYVVFHRDQTARLNAIEDRILRIQSVLQPAGSPRKVGFVTPKPPTMRTTWLIIYVILGFLALLTILVTVRSLGRSRAEGTKEGPGAG